MRSNTEQPEAEDRPIPDAPGWATAPPARPVPERTPETMPFPAAGLHPDDFLRELTGETSNEAPAPSTESTVPQRPQRPVRTPVAPVDPLGPAAQETATADPFDAADPFSASFEAATQAAADPFSASASDPVTDSVTTDPASDPFFVPPGESDLFAEPPDPFAPDALDAYGTYETFDTAGADPTDEVIDDENSFAAIEEPRAFGQALAEVSRPSLPYMPEQPSQSEEPAPVEPSNFASTTFEASDFEAAAHEPTVEAPPDSSHPPADTLTELPSIAAASTRIEGDIRIGPRPGHHPRGIAGGIVAAGLLFGGMAFAYRSSEPAAISGTPTLALPATPDEGADMPDELAFIYGVAVADIQNTAASAIVELGLDGCGLTGTAIGVAVSDDTILARHSDLITDVQPTIRLANGEIMEARVIGFDTARDLAVVRSSGALPSFLDLAGEALLRPGSGLFIADNNAGLGFEIQPVEVLELHGRNGVATTISVTSAEGSSAAGPGSPLIDPRGNLVALMGPDGRAELADDLRSLVGRYFLANQDQEAICPAPDVAIDPETGEPIAPATDAEGAPVGD